MHNVAEPHYMIFFSKTSSKKFLHLVTVVYFVSFVQWIDLIMIRLDLFTPTRRVFSLHLHAQKFHFGGKHRERKVPCIADESRDMIMMRMQIVSLTRTEIRR